MMSETLSQDPDGLGAAYTTLAPSYPPTPATPSSTIQEGPPGANLPPFSTFSADMDSGGSFSSVSDRLFSDARLLDISNWDYYTEARLLDRGENALSIITSQPQYRPWESKPVDASTSTYATTTPVNTLAEAFAQQNGASKLPSFQSQFQSFNETATTTEPTLTTLTNLTPVSPNSSSPQSHTLTTLNSNFHTLSARNYPLVPAPIQAREIPSIQQQFLDERHIQLYSHPPTNITLNNTLHPTFLNSQNGAIIQNNQLISSPTVVTVLKSEPDIKLTTLQDSIKIQNVGLHPTQFQNPMTQIHTNTDAGLYNGVEKKINGNMNSPTRNDFRKKERRKIRASSLESSVDSDGASSNMDIGSENSGQVAAISSTAGFKTHQMHVNSSIDMDTDISGGSVDKQVKKKRKRCGECVGCQRKDNCGDCAPCRNDKSHQICKQRRCEKLTEKKNLYQDGFLRGESRRGRGKGRGGASYRGRKPAGSGAPLGGGPSLVSNESNGSSVVTPSVQPPSRPSPQPTQVQQSMPVQQQPMTPMPFYADPNRFPTPVWQADPSQGWPQGQFIQQIPAAGQPIETYQQYPNGIYQATYQQPAFETNTFYTGAVQVLTNTRPPSAPNQQVQLAPPRPNSNYSHTPSPNPAQQQQQQTNNGRQYQEYSIQGNQQTSQQNFLQGATSGSDNNQTGTNSRPSSVNSIMNPPTPNPNFSPQQQQQQSAQQSNNTYTPITNFSPNYVNANSGNAQPGYPQVNNSSPQLDSHSSSGYPGQEQYSGQQWQNDGQIIWEQQVKMEPNYEPHQEQTNNQYMQQQNDNNKMDDVQATKTFSQADKVNLNTRIKTMILNKQQENNKMEDTKEQNSTGHFLSYSHHHRLTNSLSVDGGVKNRFDSFKSAINVVDSSQIRSVQMEETLRELKGKRNRNFTTSTPVKNMSQDKCRQLGMEIPSCKCFPLDGAPPEPGTYYTHLGCANNLKSLRYDLECRTGVKGVSIRIEKIRYTGKEGKTAQGCPIAKWVIRRQNKNEKYLVIVKQRHGHYCRSAFIVVCLVAWDGVDQENSDELYNLLSNKLNNYGIPTKRRCSTNDPRTCACQGIDETTCGASYTFGCSWSMYYNGCKFTRSKEVRKFRLTDKHEEAIIEDKLQNLADHISPIYRSLAPQSFENQIRYENIASDCRLGKLPGRPFSGVTACLDFCAHAHKDLHNMIDGLTVVVTLCKHRGLEKPPDEQLHVLPLYIPEDTDEFNSKENQERKVEIGAIEVLEKYTCEVRTSSTPAEKCVIRRSKKNQGTKKPKKKSSTPESPSSSKSSTSPLGTNEVQSNQITSTVSGYPNKTISRYETFSDSSNNSSSSSSWYSSINDCLYGNSSYVSSPSPTLPKFSVFKTPYNQDYYYSPYNYYPSPYNNYSYSVSNNPFDDSYSNIDTTPPPIDNKEKTIDISYTDNSECFRDVNIGGVAIALPHGSILFECAKHELHATTALKVPNRISPTRISLVFYQHRNMNKPQHGLDEYTEKMRRKLDGIDIDVSHSLKTNNDIVVRAPTLPSQSFTTVFPMYPCIVTGPYQEKMPFAYPDKT
ncbi:methylcytosine dioxygenase TET isoform X1 [Diorhabda carinulata]|uniref:methylcytosine dioxygenase TET isoform X1 n=1 Tax=Diorhabda carinulata TaxID=1163345 RepID=UPI0025A00F53|nr:methylcytosine dioxygenase TET isoform X1 [Diorhabda carinulata]